MSRQASRHGKGGVCVSVGVCAVRHKANVRGLLHKA